MKSLDYRITEKTYEFGKQRFNFWSILSRRALLVYLFAFIIIWIFSGCTVCVLLQAVVILIVPILVAFIMRRIIKRPRPQFEDKKYVPWLAAYSFPSLHGVTAFAFATGLTLLMLDIWTSPWVIVVAILLHLWAGVISFSRLALGVHYLSDIIFGALLGTLLSVILLGL